MFDINKVKEEGRYLERTLFTTFIIVAAMWIVWGCDHYYHLNLCQYGLAPREKIGLRGIFLSPMIHDDKNMMHVLSNTPPFAALFFLLLNAYRKIAAPAFILIWLVQGILLWLFGPANTSAVGMSGVLFGLATFLIGSGIFRRNLVSLTLALMVIFFYGGMLSYGVMPHAEHPEISWQGHVCGGVAGFFVAFNFRNYGRTPGSIITSDDKHFFS